MITTIILSALGGAYAASKSKAVKDGFDWSNRQIDAVVNWTRDWRKAREEAKSKAKSEAENKPETEPETEVKEVEAEVEA